MAATTRWVEYSVAATTYAASSNGRGTRGYKDSTLLVGTENYFTLTSSNNHLFLQFDGSPQIDLTLATGTNLDPRFIAKNIAEKIHGADSADKYQLGECIWSTLPTSSINGFRIFSGTIGSSSSVAVNSGTNTAHLTLGFSTGAGTGGANTSFGGGGSYTFNGNVLTSGTFNGFWDERYLVMVGTHDGITSTAKGGSNTYAGTMTTGGIFAYSDYTAYTYTIDIDTTNGTTVGAGASNVPRYKVTSTCSDNNPASYTPILYPDYWYPIGTKGVLVKWTDAVFNTCSGAWTVTVQSPQYAAGSNTTAPVGTAQYSYSTMRGGYSGDSVITTVSGGYTRLGTRGLYITFSGTTDLAAREVYMVMTRGPQPTTYDISQLNFGNVTVTTESTVKVVSFEIMSGAYEISSVKFGLQSHGTFVHHDLGDSDTKFRFGTVGPGHTAGSAPTNGYEWYTNIASTDIDSDTPPLYLYATKEDLAVVASADLSESIGSVQTYLQADPVWLNIRLGANETGANSTINYRLYFDYA